MSRLSCLGLTQAEMLQVTSQWANQARDCYLLFSSQKKSQKEHSNPKEQQQTSKRLNFKNLILNKIIYKSIEKKFL